MRGDIGQGLLETAYVPASLAGVLVPGSARGYRRGAELASRQVSLYNPPSKPARPFEEDYPSGARTDEAGNLTYDIDGEPLQVGGRIVGRRVAGGADEALSPAEFDAIAEEGTGRVTAFVAPSSFRRPGSVGAVEVNRWSGRPLSVKLSNKLTPAELPKVYGHEVGHVIDQLAGEIPTDGLMTELRKVYNTLKTGRERTRNLARPEHEGYRGSDVPRELMAEAIRAYMADPNYLKTVAPRTAERIRQYVNTHHRLKHVIQFNELAAAVGGGTAAAVGLSAATQQEER